MGNEIAQTSVYLTPEDQKRLNDLRKRTGLTRSGALRLALHNMSISDDDRRARLLKIAKELEELA